MTDMESRLQTLESIEAIRRQLVRLNDRFDAPYDADGLAAMWTEDGCLEACDGQFRGRKEIHGFFSDLVASFTMHYATNGVVVVEPSGQRASAHWYGWETPVISDSALIGAFSSDQEYECVGGEWRWRSLRETVHFLCSAESGWVEESEPRKERESQGATRRHDEPQH